MGGVAVGHRRAGATRAAAGSVPQRDHHAAAGAPQFRLQTSQELLSRRRRAAGSFPGLPCYEHFVALQKSVFVPLVVFLHSHLGTGLYYIDSTALATIIALAGTRSSGPTRQDGLVLRLQAAP